MAISDSKFIQRSTSDKQYDKKDFLGIVNAEKWSLDHVAELVGARKPPPEDDLFPAGTNVEFATPDGILYKGRVASKSGEDYIVDTTPGESYLVPPGKLAHRTPNVDDVRNAVRHEIAPTMEVVSEYEEPGRLTVRVAFKEKHPADSQLMNWAADHYPQLRLVDAMPQIGRQIDLVFEIQAAEDVRPQGSAPHMPGERGRGLSSPEIDGTGVIGEVKIPDDKIPGGLSEEPLKQGIEVEIEHTDDPVIAKEIAMDHLVEDAKYYDKLKTIEANKEFSLESVVKTAQTLGQPGGAAQFEGLQDAARKTLQAFNINNPKYYAAPQETETFGEAENSGVRLWFTLHGKEGEKTSPMYITRQGSIVPTSEQDAKPARGFVQITLKNGNPDIPMVMIQGPAGPEAVQEYGFSFAANKEAAWGGVIDDILTSAKHDQRLKAAIEKYVGLELMRSGNLHEILESLLKNNVNARAELIQFVQTKDPGKRQHLTVPSGPLITNWPGQDPQYSHGIQPIFGPKKAQYDACMAAAEEVYNTRGYSADACAEYDARLTKLGVDKETKKVLTKYFKDYGEMMIRNIPRKKHAQVESHKEVDPATVAYWVNYFGSSLFDDGWYGKQLVRTIPKKEYRGDGTIRSVDINDEEGVIGNPEPDDEEVNEKTAQTNPTGPQYPKMETGGPGRTKQTRYRRPAPPVIRPKPPGFFEQLRKSKTAPVHQKVEQLGHTAKDLLAHAKINPKVKEWITTAIHKYQGQNPGARDQAVKAIRLKNPQWQPPAGWGLDDTLYAALLPPALMYVPGLVEQATKMIGASAESPQDATIRPKTVEYMASKIANSDYAAYIKETDGSYEVKSKKNPKWSGGTYKSKGAAEKRLQQVEMFKHMSFVLDGDEPDTIFNKISEYLDFSDNLKDILTTVMTFVEDETVGVKSAEIVKQAKTLLETLQYAIDQSERDPALAGKLKRLYHRFMDSPRGLATEQKVLEGTDQRHPNQEQIAEILYRALRERKFFKQFQQMMDEYDVEQKQKEWKDIGKERKELLRKERPGIMEWMRQKFRGPETPKKPVKEDVEPSLELAKKPWEREEPEYEHPEWASEAPLEITTEPIPPLPKRTPPPPPMEEETIPSPKSEGGVPTEEETTPVSTPTPVEKKPLTPSLPTQRGLKPTWTKPPIKGKPKPEVEEHEVTSRERGHLIPDVIREKLKKEQFGKQIEPFKPKPEIKAPGTLGPRKEERKPEKLLPPEPPPKEEMTLEEKKRLQEIAKEFSGTDSKLRDFMVNLLRNIPFPVPKTKEQQDYYRRQLREKTWAGKPAVIGMNVWQICEYEPKYAMKYLVPYFRDKLQDEASARAITNYLQNKDIYGFVPVDVRKKIERPVPKGKQPLMRWKDIVESPELAEEKGQKPAFMPSKWDTWVIPDFNVNISQAMENVWNNESDMNTFLDHMALMYPQQMMEWAKEALPAERIDSFFDNLRKRIEKQKGLKKHIEPIEKAKDLGTTKSVTDWVIPENDEVPEFVGLTLLEAFKKNKPATLKYMLGDENRRTILLQYIQHMHPSEYQSWLDKISDMEKGTVNLTKSRSKALMPIPTGEHKGKIISEVMHDLRGGVSDPKAVNEQMIEFLAEVRRDAPESYQAYIDNMDPDIKKIYQNKLKEMVESDKFQKLFREPTKESGGSTEKPKKSWLYPEGVAPDKITKGRHKGKSVSEIYEKLDGEELIKFLAEVYEDDTDAYEAFMKTIEDRDALDTKVLRYIENIGQEIEETDEDEELEQDLTRGEEEEEEMFGSPDIEPEIEEVEEDEEDEEDETAREKAVRDAIYGGELRRTRRADFDGEIDMRKWSKAGPGPFAHNAPGKDDKKDYDYKERNKQPARARQRFKVLRMHSTSSSSESGYVIMEVGWSPEQFKGMSPQNVQHQLISFIKGLESDKFFHDFGVIGRVHITTFDEEAGVAEVKFRAKETRGIISVNYCTDDPSVMVPGLGRPEDGTSGIR